MSCPSKTSACRNFETIPSGFDPLLIILSHTVLKHSNGPVQMGRLSTRVKESGMKLASVNDPQQFVDWLTLCGRQMEGVFSEEKEQKRT